MKRIELLATAVVIATPCCASTSQFIIQRQDSGIR